MGISSSTSSTRIRANTSSKYPRTAAPGRWTRSLERASISARYGCRCVGWAKRSVPTDASSAAPQSHAPRGAWARRGTRLAHPTGSVTCAMIDSTPLIVPTLSSLNQALAPWAEALLRAVVGLALVPHGLRMAFGFFPATGGPIRDLSMMAAALDRWGYHPGRLWAPLIAATQLIAGPMLALGLFTRVAAAPIFIFLLVSNVERWRVGGYFWNRLGLEYTLMWTIAAFYFLVHGGGLYSLDHVLIGRE